MSQLPKRSSGLHWLPHTAAVIYYWRGLKDWLGLFTYPFPPCSPSDLWPSFPQSMKRMSSGTWMMKGDEILINGETVLALQNRNSLRNLRVSHVTVQLTVGLCTAVLPSTLRTEFKTISHIKPVKPYTSHVLSVLFPETQRSWYIYCPKISDSA